MADDPHTSPKGLKRYSIGEKLRHPPPPQEHGPGGTRQADGLSAALLSKLERGKLFPTLPTLLRIAMVFGVGFDYFFTDERKRRVVGVVRREERVRFRSDRAPRMSTIISSASISGRRSASSAPSSPNFKSCRSEAQGAPASRNSVSLSLERGVDAENRQRGIIFWRPRTPFISIPPSPTAIAAGDQKPVPE